MAPDTAENTVLLRVGILKLVNHCDREASTNRLCKRFAIFAAQRRIKATQHVIKTQLAPPALFARHGIANFRHRTGDHQIVKRQGLRQQSFNCHKQGMFRHNAVGFGPLNQETL